jgi:hypothetical protein
MSGYQFDCVLPGSEFPKIVQSAIRPCDLHAPNLAFLHSQQNRAARPHKVRLITRAGNDFSSRFPFIAMA